MNGIVFVEAAAVEATTGHMIVSFESGGDTFRFHLPAHVALRFRQTVMQDAWQVCCAPEAEVIELKRKPTRKRKAKPK